MHTSEDDDAAKQLDEKGKGVIFKKNNNTTIHNAKDKDVVMWTYYLIEYNDIYSKTSGSLW